MRVFKPLPLSLLHKTYCWQNQNQLAVTLLLGFPFDTEAEVLLEQNLWQLLPEQLGKDSGLDNCMPKIQGEVVVYGNYYSPGSSPVTADEVRLDIGKVKKNLLVIGDRYWRTLFAPTAPEPFSEMPISYEKAFGGKDFYKNPTGKGMDKVDLFGEMRLPMPNIEDPDHLVTSTDHRPDPAGLGPLDQMWEQRAIKTGTYDEAWQREHFPGYPIDLDWTHFNTAPSDQWIDGFWQGGENFSLTNMHAQKQQVQGKLPAFRTRCFVEKRQGNGTLFTEIEMRAETVCLFPNVETGVLIYRGVIQVEDDDAMDVEHMLLAYEDLAQPPRSKEYYEEALRNRLDESKVFRYMMSTKDIIPESERCGYARMLDEAGSDSESAFAQNMDARVEAEKQKALDMLEEQKQQLKIKLETAGIDPAPYMKKFDVDGKPPDDPYLREIMETMEKILPGSTQGDGKQVRAMELDFGKFEELTQKMDVMVDARKEEARQQLRVMLKKIEGTEVEPQLRERVEEVLKRMDELPDLPRPLDDEALVKMKLQLQQVETAKQQLRDQGVAEDRLPKVDISIDEIEQKMQQAFEDLKETYRSGAQFVDGKPPHTVPMDVVQYRFKKIMDKGESLAGRDLAGVDLSGLDLSGKDMSGCYLEYANLGNTILVGAILDRAIVTHANLSGANLTRASLVKTNFGASKLGGADLTDAITNETEFSKADLESARIVNCNLSDNNFLETRFAGADLSGSDFSNSNFLELDFQGANFSGCNLSSCNFVKGQMQAVNFSKAILEGANFVECNLEQSRFVEARMTNVRFPGGCTLTECNFDNAVLDKANLRETEASHSRFEGASFNQADFGGANLQHTRFYGGVGKRAMFVKSDLKEADLSSVNLMEGSLMKARLTNANLSHSNFYAVEFLHATIGDTDFTGANLDLTKLEDWGPGR